MNWYEKISGMSREEMARFFATVEIESFVAESCKLCSCAQDNGLCSSDPDKRTENCTRAMEKLLEKEGDTANGEIARKNQSSVCSER